MIELGQRVRDTVTGFEGIATGHTKWLTGCDTFGLQSTTLAEDGTPMATQWFDVLRLEAVPDEPVIPRAEDVDTNGGPQPIPLRNTAPGATHR